MRVRNRGGLSVIARENGATFFITILEARPHLAIENNTVVESANNGGSTDTLKYFLDALGLFTLIQTLLEAIYKNVPNYILTMSW